MDEMERDDPDELVKIALGWVSIADKGLSPYVVASEVKDDSMSPTIVKGDLVISDSRAPVSPGCIVVAGVEGADLAVVRAYGEITTTNQVILAPKDEMFGGKQIYPRSKIRFLRRAMYVQRPLP
jgi:SOS-response transcriptional repressor LexA